MPKPDAPELGTDGLDAPVLGDPRTRCAVLGTEFFQFTLMDPANPLKGGVKMVHVGMPPE